MGILTKNCIAMKKIIFTLSLLLIVSIASANNRTEPAMNKSANAKSSLLSPTKAFNHPMTSLWKIKVNKQTNPTDALAEKCKIEGKLTVQTEEGDEVKIEFTITADTCLEARRVMNKVLEVFE